MDTEIQYCLIMAKRILIVDYGMGNLLSVANAIREIGHQPYVSSNPAEITSADYLIRTSGLLGRKAAADSGNLSRNATTRVPWNRRWRK